MLFTENSTDFGKIVAVSATIGLMLKKFVTITGKVGRNYS